MASTAQLLYESPVTPTPVLELPVGATPPGFNRRFEPRIAQPFVIECSGLDARWQGVDLSFGGLMCVGPEPLWPGNAVDLTIKLGGDQQPLYVQGRVLELVPYRGKVGMRIRIEEASNRDRRRIAAWMARR